MQPGTADVVALVGMADTAAALPEVDLLQRLVNLLRDDPEYRALAVLYARSLVDRFSRLAEKSPDLQRRIEAVLALLNEMLTDETVSQAIPRKAK